MLYGKTSFFVLTLITVTFLAACNSGSSSGSSSSGDTSGDSSGGSSSGSSGGSSSGSSDAAVLDGRWGGILEDINMGLFELAVTIDDLQITEVESEGSVTDETASITKLQTGIFEYQSNFDVTGGLITDPGANYAVSVNRLWEFGVFQKGAESPFGTASIADLNGIWAGTAVALFGDTLLSYPVEATCTSGDCVVTITGPVVDAEGETVADPTGEVSTWNFEHRIGMVFDADITDIEGNSGFGGGSLSKDREFIGAYICQSSGVLEDCEFGALVKQ